MEKINIAELLKNCLSGVKLDCAMYDNLYFDFLDGNTNYPIHCCTIRDGMYRKVRFSAYGICENDKNAKIYPSGKTTWEGFTPPCEFEDGDVVSSFYGCIVGITSGGLIGCEMPAYCYVFAINGKLSMPKEKDCWAFERFATEKEKENLFKAIEESGLKWNAETKTLERLN